MPREHFEEASDDVAAHLARRYGVPVHVVDELRSVAARPGGEPRRRATSPMPALPEWVARRVRPQPLALERDPRPTAPAAGEPSPAVRPGRAPAPARPPAALRAVPRAAAPAPDPRPARPRSRVAAPRSPRADATTGHRLRPARCLALFSRGRSTTDGWPGGDARAVPALPLAAGTPVALAAPRTRRVGDRAALSRLSPGLVRARADRRGEAPRPGAQAGPHRAREAPRGDRPDRLPGAGRGLHLGPATATRSCRRTSGLRPQT